MIFSAIALSFATPFIIHYSSYMKLMLFQNLPKYQQVFLFLNLTCLGALSAIAFDLMNKLIVILYMIAFITSPFFGVQLHTYLNRWYNVVMHKMFILDEENLRVFEIQRRVTVPLFQDVPIIIIQLLMYTILGCKDFIDDNLFELF